MKNKRRLNKKGRRLLFIFLILIVLFIGLFLIKDNFNKKDEETVKPTSTANTKKEEKKEETQKEEKQEDKKEEENKQEEENKKEESNTNKTSKGFIIEEKDGITYIDGILIANKTYSLPSSYNPGDLLDVFKDNFNKMQSDASNEGISLNVISGFRSYDRQNTLYNNYVNKDGKDAADTYSARPGHSEHQTGLAADINSLYQSFENTNEGKWLNNNCYKYGFIIRYVKGKENITGYIFEPWHIRYVGKELAEKLYNGGNWITLEEYFGIDSKY